MIRYIDADELEKAVLKPSMFDINKDDVIALIAEQTTADVVEVVRCKDCVRNGTMYCVFDPTIAKNEDAFCSYGERRDT